MKAGWLLRARLGLWQAQTQAGQMLWEQSGQCGVRDTACPVHMGQQKHWLATQPNNIHWFSVLA